MTRSDGANGLASAVSQARDLHDPPAGVAASADSGSDRCHLTTILSFLKQEIDQSGALLHDLAGCLSYEFSTVSQTNDLDAIRQRMVIATIALQNEDRIQQRLGDLRLVLSLLEGALLRGTPAIGADLDHAIIDQLRLDELRVTFAYNVGMASEPAAPSPPAGTPTIGDIDLF
ncbi:MAG: hypothetical protein R3F54_20390 [Alphaproteobacteria bacterium]